MTTSAGPDKNSIILFFFLAVLLYDINTPRWIPYVRYDHPRFRLQESTTIAKDVNRGGEVVRDRLQTDGVDDIKELPNERRNKRAISITKELQ